MIVDRNNYPHVRAAFCKITCDSGGHLLGTVYPGERIDLERFDVPESWSYLVSGAELGLARLRIPGVTDLDNFGEDSEIETFVVGEQSEAEAIEKRQGDLAEARILLDDFFNGWQPEDAPFSKGASLPQAQEKT